MKLIDDVHVCDVDEADVDHVGDVKDIVEDVGDVDGVCSNIDEVDVDDVGDVKDVGGVM